MAAAGRAAVVSVLALAVPAAQASEDSPLVCSQEYSAGGVAVSWIFGDSSTRVRVDE